MDYYLLERLEGRLAQWQYSQKEGDQLPAKILVNPDAHPRYHAFDSWMGFSFFNLNQSIMESLALVSFVSFIVGVIALIVFFVMASNISAIRSMTNQTNMRLMGIQSSLDRIVKHLEQNEQGLAPVKKAENQ